jgi:dihydrofolate reductase
MSNVRIVGVMACGKNGVVGNNGAIPWNYPDEFQHFKGTIGNHPIVLGRKSFDLLPKSISEDRINIVFSRQKKLDTHGGIVVSSLEEFYALDILKNTDKIFMIGGAQLANFFLEKNLITEFILTKFDRAYAGDAVLNIKTFNSWKSKVIKKTPDYTIYKLTSE